MVALPQPWFDARTSGDGTRLTLSLRGELDCATTDLAYAELKLAAAVAPELTIDPCGLTFLDATGLHVFLYACELYAGPGRSLRVVAGNPYLDRLVELTHIRERFEFVTSA